MAVSVVYGCGPNLTRPGSGWHTIPLLLWGRNFQSGPAGWSWLRALQGHWQDDTWAAASEARLRPERPCLRGSHAWSSAGGLSSEPFADPRDVASSSILGIFQLLSKHVLQESEIVEGDVVPFESYCRMSHAGVSAMS